MTSWTLFVVITAVGGLFGWRLAVWENRRDEERGRRLALAIEDETNDALAELAEEVDRGKPIAGPFGDLHSGCFAAYQVKRYDRCCDECFDLIGMGATAP